MNPKALTGIAIAVLLVAGAALWTMRGGTSSTQSLTTDYVDPQITEFHNLGLLGAEGHPATKTVKFADPDNSARTLSVGGIVLREIQEQSPLTDAGCRVGDVLVKVGDDYLPNKEDPTLDLIAGVEGQISAGKKEIALGRLREGQFGQITIPVTVPSLEAGYPLELERFKSAAQKGLAHLAAIQREDGSFTTDGDTVGAKVTVSSLAGLTFLASGSTLKDGDYSANVKRCFDFVGSHFADEPDGDTPSGDLSAFNVSWALMFLSELSATEKMNMGLMQSMASCMGRLLTLQGEDGGWQLADDPDTYGFSETTLATNQALIALGMVERCGVMGPNEPIEKACDYIKKQTGDGKVVTADVPGFDRRSEAGRSAGAGAALKSIGCTTYDAFFTQLVDYNSKLGTEIASGRVAVPLHILNTAVLRRQKGNRAWGQFVDDFRLLLTSLQRGDGSFAQIPGSTAKQLEFEKQSGGDAWLTATYTLAMLLQEDNVPVLLCKHETPMAKTRDSDGKAASGDAPEMTMGDMHMPPGGQMITIDDPEELRKMLESMGMDSKQIDDMLSGKSSGGDFGSGGSFQVMTSGGPPPEGFRRHKKNEKKGDPDEGEAGDAPAGVQMKSFDSPEEMRKHLESMGMDAKQIDEMLSGEGPGGSIQEITIDATPPEKGTDEKAGDKPDQKKDDSPGTEEGTDKKRDVPADKEKQQDKETPNDATP